ncbi:MAG: methyltransferase domain-containing protein [Candidatus Aminicenantes bacterium]|nr:MAG: methyltransferase domain-containing protein [Candidatus Aminicenantes bacterium]
MTADIFFEIHQDLPREGPGRNKYTRKAFHILPKLDKPRILDVGCGTGGPTLELARLSQGEVVGVDIHQPYLDKFSRKIEQAGLSDRVKAMNSSMFKMNFLDESFDIIWAEGSIFIIGFERGLKEWRRFIKPNKFLVVHEMAWLQPDPPQEIDDYWKKLYAGIMTVPENLEVVSGCGYSLIGHFTLPEDAWWLEYYGPLEKRIQKLRIKYTDNPKALAVLDEEQLEIEMFKKYSKWYGSVFFIMQKR